jgi:hypothetical protein
MRRPNSWVGNALISIDTTLPSLRSGRGWEALEGDGSEKSSWSHAEGAMGWRQCLASRRGRHEGVQKRDADLLVSK